MNESRRREDEQLARYADEEIPAGERYRFKARHQYDEAEDAKERLATDISDFSYTERDAAVVQQQYTEDVDLNVMMKRMGVKDGAVIPPFFHESITADMFRDTTEIQELGFRGAMDHVREASAAFDALPAALRRRFGYSPAELMAFLNDPENNDEAVKLGLLNRMPDKLPDDVKTRRELAAWIKKNPKEAEDLGYLKAVMTPPPQTPAAGAGVT